MPSDKLPPVQEILRQIEPYQSRVVIAIGVFTLITLWFITCTSTFPPLVFRSEGEGRRLMRL